MPSFTEFLLFILGWFILAILVVVILNIFKWNYGRNYSTVINRYYIDIEVYIPEERIFSVDSSGETTFKSYDGTILATLYEHDEDPVEFYVYPNITVDDSESHDMFRKVEVL